MSAVADSLGERFVDSYVTAPQCGGREARMKARLRRTLSTYTALYAVTFRCLQVEILDTTL
jgi:hypothetical protein